MIHSSVTVTCHELVRQLLKCQIHGVASVPHSFRGGVRLTHHLLCHVEVGFLQGAIWRRMADLILKSINISDTDELIIIAPNVNYQQGDGRHCQQGSPIADPQMLSVAFSQGHLAHIIISVQGRPDNWITKVNECDSLDIKAAFDWFVLMRCDKTEVNWASKGK